HGYRGLPPRDKRRHGTNDCWVRPRAPALPRETRDYVPRIQAAILVGNAPQRYGFEIDPVAPQPVDTIQVDGPFALRDVARCTGLEMATLRDLNPELMKPATPAHRAFDLKVPQGRADGAAACLGS